jgi:hypothetical protein
MLITNESKTNFMAFSPEAKYTDRSATACRRSECQLLLVRGCYVISARDIHGS